MKIEVLDHGYVELVEAWGVGRDGVGEFDWDPGAMRVDDEITIKKRPDYEVGIIEAARQSTQGAFRGWEPAACDCGEDARRLGVDRPPGPPPLPRAHAPDCASVKNLGDARLLKYLYEHRHATPFEFAGMVLEVQAPLFVFREWHRHRTQSYSEMSARYAALPDLCYTPRMMNVLERARAVTANRQSRGEEGAPALDGPAATEWLLDVERLYGEAEAAYHRALAAGVPKELARVTMPVGHYSRMRASANLRNWLAFLTLRTDPAAQWEIRQYAEAVARIVNEIFPRTYALWAAR